jgi:hypothetical protein
LWQTRNAGSQAVRSAPLFLKSERAGKQARLQLDKLTHPKKPSRKPRG